MRNRAELYQLKHGARAWYFTDQRESITHAGIEYLPIRGLQRTAIEDESIDKCDTEVTFPQVHLFNAEGEDLAAIFAGKIFYGGVTITILELYQGEDIYFKPLLLDGDSLEMTLTQHQNIVDNDVGGFQQFTHWKKPRYLKPFKSLLKGWDQYTEYRQFLFRRMGRYQAFWMPLYEKHLNILNTGNISTSLSTNTKYVLEADRKHIAVKRKNGTWTAHEITAKTGGSLTVSPAINAHRNDIQTICYLGLHRFDADQIEFQFLGAQITQVTVPIVELSS